MRKQKRWIKSVIEASKDETVMLPWQRGVTRAQHIAARKGQAKPLLRLRSA